ncbi:AAA family ATPase [Bifidobacterium aquikefiri]
MSELVIPQRFQHEIQNHLVGNLVGVPDFPLILAIFGSPGIGKTFQLRSVLKLYGFSVFSISSADLESEFAGRPAKELQQQYLNAGATIRKGIPAAIVIDDIDTTLGEWKQNTGTVNHQELLAFLMHLADDPIHIGKFDAEIARVPLFVTGNDFTKIYKPLARPGRTRQFEWVPTVEEKRQVLNSLPLSTKERAILNELVQSHPDESIAFYASCLAKERMASITKRFEDMNYARLITDKQLRKQLKSEMSNQAFHDLL